METRFNRFINENNNSFDDFIDDIIVTYKNDFNYDDDQAQEFIELHNDLLIQLWENDYTPREAITATQRPGFKI